MKPPKWYGNVVNYVARAKGAKKGNDPWLIVIELPRAIKSEKTAEHHAATFFEWVNEKYDEFKNKVKP